MNILAVAFWALIGVIGFVLISVLADALLSLIWRKVAAPSGPVMPGECYGETNVRHAFHMVEIARPNPKTQCSFPPSLRT